MRCWPEAARRAAAGAAVLLATTTLLLAGCATGTSAPTFAPPSPAARNLPLFVGSHGGINTGGGPVSVGVGVAQQTQLVSGSGVRVSTGADADGGKPGSLQSLRTPQQLLEAGLLAVQAGSARMAATNPAVLRPGSD